MMMRRISKFLFFYFIIFVFTHSHTKTQNENTTTEDKFLTKEKIQLDILRGN